MGNGEIVSGSPNRLSHLGFSKGLTRTVASCGVLCRWVLLCAVPCILDNSASTRRRFGRYVGAFRRDSRSNSPGHCVPFFRTRGARLQIPRLGGVVEPDAGIGTAGRHGSWTRHRGPELEKSWKSSSSIVNSTHGSQLSQELRRGNEDDLAVPDP